eukprot:2429600-Alexandrium_andersonii.AAC.1
MSLRAALCPRLLRLRPVALLRLPPGASGVAKGVTLPLAGSPFPWDPPVRRRLSLIHISEPTRLALI